MKSYLKNILALGAVSVLFSCQSEMEPVGPAVDFEPKVLVAKVDDNVKADDEPSRTSLAEGRMVRWSSSDRIVAFEDENPTLSDENTTVTDNGAIASFTFSQTPLETNFFWALYPADMTATYDWAEIHTAGIPVEQRAVAGSFANNANLAVADATVDDDVQFKNIGALLSLSFTSTKKISSIILKTTEETLAGSVLIEPETLDFVVDEGSGEVTLTKVNATSGTYYFVVYPGTYEGIDVIFRSTDGGRAAYHSSATLTIGRNEVMFIRDFQIKDSKWEMIPQVPGAWTKVTDVSDLADGDEIVITDEDVTYALSTDQRTNNRGAAAVSTADSGATISISDNVQIITLEASGSNWKFKVGEDAYLYACSSSQNYIRTASAADAGSNGVWKVTASSAVAQGNYTRNTLQYNSSSTLFACYGSASQKDITFYKYAAGRDAVQYDITIDEATGGSVTTDPSEKAYETHTVTITVTPDDGYSLVSLTVVDDEDNEITVTDGSFVMPSSNVTITPVFSLGLKTITTVAENGSISIDPGTSVAPDTEVTITAVPDTGYEFVSWSVTGATPASTTANPTTFTMPDSDVTVTATFAISLPEWELVTNFSSIESGGKYIFVNVQNSTSYYMNTATCNQGAGTGCVALTKLPTEPGFEASDNMILILTGSASSGFLASNLDGNQLVIGSTNNGLSINSNTGTSLTFYTDSGVKGYTLKGYDTATTPVLRYIGMNSTTNFRCYNSVNNNVKMGEYVWYHFIDNTVWNLKSIAVTTHPTKTTYEAGENFDATGMVVTATYEDEAGVKADKQVVLDNADLTISPSTNLTAGTTSVTITYEGKSTTQAITVTAPVVWDLREINVTTPPTKTTYTVGETFDPTGMVVTATYENHDDTDDTKDVIVAITDLSFSPSTSTALTTDDTSVTISYGGKSTTQEITVSEPVSYEDFTWDLSKAPNTSSANALTWVYRGMQMGVAKSTATTDANNYCPPSQSSTRFYKNSVLTITPYTGTTIGYVEFTATTNNYASALGNSTWTNGTASVSGSKVTVTPTNGSNAFSATIGATCGFTAVTVYYTGDLEAVVTKTITFTQPTETGCSIAVTVGGQAITSGDAIEKGTSVTISATAGSGYTFSEWTVSGATPANASSATTTFEVGDNNITISATFATSGGSSTPDPVDKNYSFAFTAIGSTGWSSSYANHTLYNDSYVKIDANASKQTGTITDYPVTKGQPLTVVLKDGTMNSVTFTCSQWGSKAQTITLHYSTNSGSTYTSTGITSTNFSIISSSLPSGTNAVKITFSSTSNQVGLNSVSFNYTPSN